MACVIDSISTKIAELRIVDKYQLTVRAIAYLIGSRAIAGSTKGSWIHVQVSSSSSAVHARGGTTGAILTHVTRSARCWCIIG